jgi:hypothetical protein
MPGARTRIADIWAFPEKARPAKAAFCSIISTCWCHEDVLLSHAYLYSLERAETPGELTCALLAANAEHFPLHPDGLVDGCAVNGGIVFNHYDGSFESWLMSHGIAYAACVETPGQQPIARRIAAQHRMIDTFVRKSVAMRP